MADKASILNSVETVSIDTDTVSISLNATVYNSSYKHQLTIYIRGVPIASVDNISWSTGTAQRTVTLSNDTKEAIQKYMFEDKSVTATFVLATCKGSTLIGTSSKTATIRTKAANSAPLFSDFTCTDSNSTTSAVTGGNPYYIQGYSTLKITPGTATSRNWSQITKYTAVCNGVTVSNTDGGVLNLGKISKSGNITVKVTVTDSRGYTKSVFKTINVIPYDRPNVYSITLRRTNEIESEMQLVFSGSISAITIDGTDKNSLKSVRYRYKKTNASSYGNFIDLLSSVAVSGTSFSFSNLELCDFDVNSSYNFHLEIRDVFDSMTVTDLYFIVPQGTPLIALRKKMVGINNPNPKAALDVTGEIYMNGFSVMGVQQAFIGDEVSLNELTAPGIYFRRSVPQENLNYPALAFGMLEVFSCSVNLVIQRYTTRDSPFDTYIRSRVNSSWSAWVKK